MCVRPAAEELDLSVAWYCPAVHEALHSTQMLLSGSNKDRDVQEPTVEAAGLLKVIYREGSATLPPGPTLQQLPTLRCSSSPGYEEGRTRGC